ncbi:hypothetical protein BS78_05G283500 [Paspalum vaginatum]|nr:hypothetical protein BS78_05G283500 [Paspalum vaginatum]
MDLEPSRENEDNPQDEPELPDMDVDNGGKAADSGPKLGGKGNSASHGKQCADALTTESMGSGLNKRKQGAATIIPNKVSSPTSKERVGKPVTPLRVSKRSAAVADQNSLERASKLKAKINLDGSPDQGTLQGNILAPPMGQVAAK